MEIRKGKKGEVGFLWICLVYSRNLVRYPNGVKLNSNRYCIQVDFRCSTSLTEYKVPTSAAPDWQCQASTQMKILLARAAYVNDAICLRPPWLSALTLFASEWSILDAAFIILLRLHNTESVSSNMCRQKLLNAWKASECEIPKLTSRESCFFQSLLECLLWHCYIY